MYKIKTEYYYHNEFTNEALNYYKMLEEDEDCTASMYVSPLGIIISKEIELDDTQYSEYAEGNMHE